MEKYLALGRNLLSYVEYSRKWMFVMCRNGGSPNGKIA